MVRRGDGVERRSLADPARPLFLRLPREDLADGTPLRRAAFDVWSRGVRGFVAAGGEFETVYRGPRAVATTLAMAGGAVVVAIASLLLITWAVRPDPAVRVEAALEEQALLVLAVAIVFGVIVAASAGSARAWLCRRGSYVQIAAGGLRVRTGGAFEPVSAVAETEYHALLRCTRIAFADGRPDLWVPAESGALRRVDLLLAALDDRLGAALRSRL